MYWLFVPSLECEFSDADQVLCDLGEALFTFMSDEPGPVEQIFVYHVQSLLVVLTQLYLETQTQHIYKCSLYITVCKRACDMVNICLVTLCKGW